MQRVIQRVALVFLLIAGFGFGSYGTQAQDREVTGPPRGITPGQKPAGKDNSSGDDGSRLLGNRPGLQDGGIQVGTLSTISDVTVGLLTPENGGFAQTIWNRSDRRAIESLIGQLPVASPSPFINDLTRRVLLTTASVPEGRTRGTPFVELRLERLFSAGHAADVMSMIEKLPALARTLNVVSLQTDAMLLSGQAPEACALASQIEDGKDLPYFLKLRALCFILNDEAAAADLTAGLFRDQGGADALFLDLIANATSGVVFELAGRAPVEPIHIVLLDRLGEPLSSEILSGALPGILAYVAGSENFDIATRLIAAEQAEALNILPSANLAALYDLATFTQEQLASPLSSTADLSPAMGNALLYKAIRTSTAPSASAEILATAMFQAKMQGRYPTAARLYWPIMRGLEPSSAFLGIAEDMTRMALLAGAVERALDWSDLLRQDPNRFPSAEADLKILLAAATQSERLSWNPAEVEQWISASRQDPSAMSRKVRELTLLDLLGFNLGSGSWIALLDAPAQTQQYVGSAAILQRLPKALSDNRYGEALILALAVIGDQNVARINAATLAEVYRAFNSLGLQDEAQQLIFDAILLDQLAITER